MNRLFVIGALLVAGWYGYQSYKDKQDDAYSDASEYAESEPMARNSGRASFQCDGRTHCSHMTSCAEATFFLRNCPNTKMDGDNDGVPCESQWCGN